jgi:hypothetical protein
MALIDVKTVRVPKLVYLDFVYKTDMQKALDIIFDSLTNSLFSSEDKSVEIRDMKGFYSPVENIEKGTIKHYTYKRNGNNWTKIRVNSKFSSSKIQRDQLVEILQSKGIEMRVGSRMKMEVRTRSLIYEYRHLFLSTASINKFNI